MNIYLNSVRGMDDAIISLYMSRPGSWDPALNEEIYETVEKLTDRRGKYLPTKLELNMERLRNSSLKEDKDFVICVDHYEAWMRSLLRFGRKHITMLRFIDLSISIKGLHRAGQDDLDAHAKRFDNRIIRNSTRAVTSTFGSSVSEYYEGRVIPTDVALAYLGIATPDEIQYDGKTYVRAANGYIVKGEENNPDVKRGLYYLALPSNCIFKINLTEFAHVYKLRNKNTHAHPELQTCIEEICDQLVKFYPLFTRELLMEIEN